MKSEYEKSTQRRDIALHVLLTRVRSFGGVRERRLTPTNKCEVHPHDEIDECCDQAQPGAGAHLHGWVSLYAIDAAFERLRRCQYGLCEDCSNEISLERLTVVPLASRCADCQWDRENKKATEDPKGHKSDGLFVARAIERVASNGTESHKIRNGRR